MVEWSGVAWAVLRAVHELQGGDPSAFVRTSAIREAVLPVLGADAAAQEIRGSGGPYAGIETPLWALSDEGLVEVDRGMAAHPVSPRGEAHDVEGDYGVRVTDVGRDALTGRSTAT